MKLTLRRSPIDLGFKMSIDTLYLILIIISAIIIIDINKEMKKYWKYPDRGYRIVIFHLFSVFTNPRKHFKKNYITKAYILFILNIILTTLVVYFLIMILN